MNAKTLDKIREMLCTELDEIADKGEMSAGDLEAVHKLTDTVKNIYKIDMLEDTGYSGTGEWEADMRGTYGRGRSYANHGSHYVRGHYSRSNGLIEKLEELADETDDTHDRDCIRRLIEAMRKG